MLWSYIDIFMEYEGRGFKLTPPPSPPEKPTLKKISLIKVKIHFGYTTWKRLACTKTDFTIIACIANHTFYYIAWF